MAPRILTRYAPTEWLRQSLHIHCTAPCWAAPEELGTKSRVAPVTRARSPESAMKASILALLLGVAAIPTTASAQTILVENSPECRAHAAVQTICDQHLALQSARVDKHPQDRQPAAAKPVSAVGVNRSGRLIELQ